jgi:hypothetical protein
MVEPRDETITEGKTLMELVTGAAWWDFQRDEVDSDDAGAYVDQLYGKLLFSLKNWNRYVEEDRRRSERGLTMDLAEIKGNGFSLVASVTARKSAPQAGGGGQFNAVLRIVKDR